MCTASIECRSLPCQPCVADLLQLGRVDNFSFALICRSTGAPRIAQIHTDGDSPKSVHATSRLAAAVVPPTSKKSPHAPPRALCESSSNATPSDSLSARPAVDCMVENLSCTACECAIVLSTSELKCSSVRVQSHVGCLAIPNVPPSTASLTFASAPAVVSSPPDCSSSVTSDCNHFLPRMAGRNSRGSKKRSVWQIHELRSRLATLALGPCSSRACTSRTPRARG